MTYGVWLKADKLGFKKLMFAFETQKPGLKASFILTVLCCLLFSGCALFYGASHKGAYAVDDWNTWTGWNDDYGSHEVKPDGLYYRLTERQDDTRNEPSDGYSPGLILSRPVTGSVWSVDLQADFKIPPGQVKRFSYGIWLGGDSTRPSLSSASAVLKLLAQRQNGPRPYDDALIITCLPGGAPVKIPKNAETLRFERNGDLFTVSYSMHKKEFKPVTGIKAAVDVPAQEFFLGGFAAGDPQGAYARFTSLKVNNRETLR